MESLNLYINLSLEIIDYRRVECSNDARDFIIVIISEKKDVVKSPPKYCVKSIPVDNTHFYHFSHTISKRKEKIFPIWFEDSHCC